MRRLVAVLGAAMLVAVSCSSSSTPGASTDRSRVHGTTATNCWTYRLGSLRLTWSQRRVMHWHFHQ